MGLASEAACILKTQKHTTASSKRHLDAQRVRQENLFSTYYGRMYQLQHLNLIYPNCLLQVQISRYEAVYLDPESARTSSQSGVPYQQDHPQRCPILRRCRYRGSALPPIHYSMHHGTRPLSLPQHPTCALPRTT